MTLIYVIIKEFLKENYDMLKALAEELVVKETLYEEDIDRILGIVPEESIEKIEEVEEKGISVEEVKESNTLTETQVEEVLAFANEVKTE